MGLNIKSILKAAAGVAAPLVAANPFGAAALAAVNHFLPEGEKLPEQATGAEVLARVEALPAEQRAAVFGQLIQADMNESDNFAANVQAMAEVDKVGGSTRPQIALLMAWYLVLTGGVLALALCLAVIDGVGSVQALAEVWPLVLAWMAPPVALLRAYFGLRTKEKHSRYAAATGQPMPELSGMSTAFRRLLGG